MSRRNVFRHLNGGAETEARPFPATGPLKALRSSLKEMSDSAVRDLDPETIRASPLHDRIEGADDGLAELTRSMAEHGQQVPIMVRPLPDAPGRYEIVYGRRRLAAMRALGLPVQAIVRNMDDTQAILAQGQENAFRVDPSFAEKAVFVHELDAAGYGSRVVMDALGIDKATLSRMRAVTRAVPPEIIRRIGPAHAFGRRPWLDLVTAISEVGLDPAALVEEAGDEGDSDDRFGRLQRAVARVKAAAGAPTTGRATTTPFAMRGGAMLGEMRSARGFIDIRISRRHAPDFSSWIEENAEDALQCLHKAWRKAKEDGG